MQLRCYRIRHEIINSLHPSQPVPSHLQAVYSPPYVLSIVPNGTAQDVMLWKMVSGGDPPLQQVTRLDSPLPEGLKWINVHDDPRILVICFFSRKRYHRQDGSKLFVYSTTSGKKLQEIALPVSISFKTANADHLVMAPALTIFQKWLPRLFIYKVTESGLEELERLPVDPDTKLDDALISRPVRYLPDGCLVTADKTIEIEDPILHARNTRGGILQSASIAIDHSPGTVLQVVDLYVFTLTSESRLVALVEEIQPTDEGNEVERLAISYVYTMTATDLSEVWKTCVPHHTQYVVHNHALDMLVVVGTTSSWQHLSQHCLTFIDPNNGTILKEELVPRTGIVRDPDFLRPRQVALTERPECTDEDFILLQPSGEAIIQSLKSIYERGLLSDESGDALLQIISLPVSERDREETTKANVMKRWIWTEDFAVGSKMIVIFPPKERDIYVIEW